jgi:Ca2+/H+ antiporter, TMEM165/GDT1 family
MGAAVFIGQAIANLPHMFVAAITTASFLWVAHAVWRKPEKPKDVPYAADDASSGAFMSFVLVLFSEWADRGQVTAATMAARFASPWAVWMGAVSAMTTKGLLAAWLGAGMRRWFRDRLSPRIVRYASVTLLAVMGVLSVVESFLGRD